MNVQELHDSVYFYLNKAGAHVLGDLEDDEVDRILNSAHIRFVIDRVDDTTPRGSSPFGFAETLLSASDIGPLVTLYGGPFTVTNDSVDISTVNPLIVLGGVAEGESCSGVPLIPKKPQHNHIIDRNPFASSDITDAINIYRTKDLLLFDSGIGSIVNSVTLNYIRHPSLINLSLGNGSELPDYTHEKIVSLAVGLALETLGDSQRYQTQSIENLKL